MPAPAVYVLAIVGAVAAGIAFKEFVYEPHLAPKFEQWAEEFLAKRKARRRQQTSAIPVFTESNQSTNDGGTTRRSRRPDSGEDQQSRQSIELENLIASEVHEWRNEVDRNQPRGLRRRGNAGPSVPDKISPGKSVHSTQYSPASPVHVLFDPTLPSTPSSTISSGSVPHSPRVSSLREAASRSSLSTLRSPNFQTLEGLPALNVPVSAPPPGSAHVAPNSPGYVPSLSQSYPLDLDLEHGIELLSAPSSRPDSPFSAFSQPPSLQGASQHSSNYHPLSPPNATSPLARPPSRSISDLDFLSDLGDHDGMSPPSSHATFDDAHLLDEVRSEISSSSWASARGRSG